MQQPLSESLDDDPKTLPITLDPAMMAFKGSAAPAASVMDLVLEHRSGMPIDVSALQTIANQQS